VHTPLLLPVVILAVRAWERMALRGTSGQGKSGSTLRIRVVVLPRVCAFLQPTSDPSHYARILGMDS